MAPRPLCWQTITDTINQEITISSGSSLMWSLAMLCNQLGKFWSTILKARQVSSWFWYCNHLDNTGVLNLLVLAYPQIKSFPLCVPPNQKFSPLRTPKSEFNPFCVPPNWSYILFVYPQIKNSTQISLFWVGFNILRTPLSFSRTPCGLLTYLRLRTAGIIWSVSLHPKLNTLGDFHCISLLYSRLLWVIWDMST